MSVPETATINVTRLPERERIALSVDETATAGSVGFSSQPGSERGCDSEHSSHLKEESDSIEEALEESPFPVEREAEGRSLATGEQVYRFELQPEEPTISFTRRIMDNKTAIYCGLIVLGIAGFLIVILVPMGFADLDYYEMGFVKSKTTGKVNDKKVYLGGRHFIGVDKTFKSFRIDSHMELFNRISVFNKQRLAVTMTCGVQYFLYPRELPLLHAKYDIHYRPVLRKTLLAAIKSAAAQFTVNEFRLERPKIAQALERAAAVALGGVCCRKNCVTTTHCSQQDRGLFAEVRYFQLELVDITRKQYEKFLRQVLETEKQDTEKFRQKEKITKKETERIKRIIENEASEVAQNATATSNLILARAEAEAKAVLEDARNSGLQIIFDVLNITKPEHKKSFDYIRTLRDKNEANIYVGFNTIVAKP